jgi:hypothetical protein
MYFVTGKICVGLSVAGLSKVRNSVCKFIQENILKFDALFYRLLKEINSI